MPNQTPSLTTAVLDDFIDLPSNEYYISNRYIGSKTGASKWSEPLKINWTNVILPDSYYEKQIVAFDLIQALADECYDQRLAAALPDLRMSFFLYVYDSPVGGTTLSIRNTTTERLSISGGMYATGLICADTCVLDISSIIETVLGHSAGLTLVSPTTPGARYDLSKSDGKMVMDYEYEADKFWVAYYSPNKKWSNNTYMYIVKKESTLRRNLTIDISVD